MSGATAVGYRVTLPAGWFRIPTGADADEACRRVVDAIAREYSDTDAVAFRRAWADRLPRAVAVAEESGALDLYLFVQRLRGRLVAMQFTVSIVFLGGMLDWTREELVEVGVPEGAEHEFLRGDAGDVLRVTERRVRTVGEARRAVAQTFGTDPSLAVEAEENPETARAVAAIDEAEARGESTAFTRLSHLVALPDAGGAFLLITTDVDDSPLAAAQLAHVDLIASTLAWTR